MEMYSIEDTKMMQFAAYCINACGCVQGCADFNTICADYTIAKKKTLEELKAELDEL